MWVLKLGGSLARAPELRAWLGAICAPHPAVRVVVPGGGPFADAVRDAQRDAGIADPIAHRMALLAMAQYGWLLHGLEPRLVPATGLSDVRAALVAGAQALWLPRVDEACNAVLPQAWDVTSDSLALWIAHELGATGVALVKSVAPAGEGTRRAVTLAGDGYLDACFPALLARSGLAACWYARGECDALRAFDGMPEPARLIVP